MKVPRIEDFDQNAKTRELGSPLDDMPAIGRPRPAVAEPKVPATDTQPTRTSTTVVPPYPVPYGVPRTPVPPRRVMKQRQPFDVYEDQYQTLKQIADEERAQGLPGSMSRMVREGIDMYLAAKKRGEK
jgi:hypothetical protein